MNTSRDGSTCCIQLTTSVQLSTLLAVTVQLFSERSAYPVQLNKQYVTVVVLAHLSL
jgi:hypothetical protein